MRVFRRLMLGGIDINSFPETKKLYYKATGRIIPKKDSLGSSVIINMWDANTQEGVIICSNDIESIGESAFENKTTLSKIVIPSKVTTIGRYAFRYCASLEQVNIQSACYIDSYAFAETSLSRINIPKGTTFGQSCFYDNSFTSGRRSREVYFEGALEDWVNIYFYNASTNPMYEYSGGSDKKPSTLYINNHIVEDISIPYLNNPSFYNCGSLKSVTIEGGSHIKRDAFSQCTNLVKITLPDTLTTIESYSFTNCTNLKHVIYKGELEDWLRLSMGIHSEWSADSSPLEYCEEFYIGKNKEPLINITIPDSITSIKPLVLSDVPTLQSITFHSNVSTISNLSISDNPLLKYCDFSNHTSIPKMKHYNAFFYIPTTCKIIVPDALYDEWIVATNWSTYADYIIKKSDWDAQQVTE